MKIFCKLILKIIKNNSNDQLLEVIKKCLGDLHFKKPYTS